MSSTERNIATINDLYAAFGRQDVPAILERLHPEVEWEMGSVDHGVPWLTPGRGREHALRFFQALAPMEFRRFAVHAVMGSGPWVMGLVEIEFVNPATGGVVHERFEPHVWRFDDAGLIVGFRHAADTAQHLRAAGLR